MITVTAEAAQVLKTRAQAEISDPEEAFRLVPAGSDRLGLTIDKEQEGDQVVEHEGVKVLLIGTELADAVDRLVLDCEDAPEGRRLIVSGPTVEP